MRTWTPIKEYTDILFEKCGKVAKITINRPQVYNAFRPLTNKEMLDAMAYCRESPEIGVVILTGIAPAELRKYGFHSAPEAEYQLPDLFWPVCFVIGRFQRHKTYTF